jgi:hypothetical protein
MLMESEHSMAREDREGSATEREFMSISPAVKARGLLGVTGLVVIHQLPKGKLGWRENTWA